MLAENLMRFRELLHWTKQTLSDQTGIDRSKISRLENGAKADQDELQHLARLFGCSIEFLLEDRDPDTIYLSIEFTAVKQKGD